MIILRWLSQGSRYCHSSRFDPLTLSLNTSFDIFWRKWGHPLAGRSRSTDVSCEKNFLLSPFFSSRTVRDLSVTRPCFLFMRCRTLVRTSHPSGSRHWKISKREFFPPLASLLAPENLQILWLPFGSNPFMARGVGVPADHNPCELYLRDGTAANQTLWF